MKKIVFLIIIFQIFVVYSSQFLAGELKIKSGGNKGTEVSDLKKVYFAGGCFWCMEESFDKIVGVVNSVSGYSGGHLKNPSYKEVIYKDTGHVETVEITYDSNKVSFEKLLSVFWKNIDPFDKYGQFCDKGKAYRSVVFFQNKKELEIIKKSVVNIENKFNDKVVTLLWKFDTFYIAEDYHQDYYEKNFLRYLAYKKACQREEVLDKIWN